MNSSFALVIKFLRLRHALLPPREARKEKGKKNIGEGKKNIGAKNRMLVYLIPTYRNCPQKKPRARTSATLVICTPLRWALQLCMLPDGTACLRQARPVAWHLA